MLHQRRRPRGSRKSHPHSWPGQACGYKVGHGEINSQREKARTSLGPKFDLREYNDAVLETGSVPLDALERHIDAWIAAKKAA